mmetsp:Transcript_22992/g.58809  ORF Transcript_22992/g.58809 Transcript_22992/m.58809 type:complete len:210 (-) Transcript_22992:463-1092(-)|eukprot:CAMPEP_0202869690 /NCGR_PEP_ID=MMETSP1391-20130828/12592_1 /ASSEMBLY_ACC=CAM_ASM_000867 /TAXON_ID=1034604 /ORGANISM="Chlamydomonas leiostraca, Strain SAG 11-49" /LENGTH=209 /DNA_ID=CAMNT_0049550033 /DNA_START=185 /DNA_END=814 /DNA_ORIENTATION=-
MDGPSTSGPAAPAFRNIEPKGRQERLAANDKTSLEKARIAARSTRGPPPPANVLAHDKNTPAYVDEHKRFADPPAVALEYQRRQENLQRKEAVYEHKRAENYWKEKSRWDKNEAVHSKVEDRLAAKRDAGEGGVKRNASSENYNILTLEYAKTPAGQQLAFKDESVRYKAQLRAINLYQKGHCVSHNIITGEPRASLPQPSRPVAPWEK